MPQCCERWPYYPQKPLMLELDQEPFLNEAHEDDWSLGEAALQIGNTRCTCPCVCFTNVNKALRWTLFSGNLNCLAGLLTFTCSPMVSKTLSYPYLPWSLFLVFLRLYRPCQTLLAYFPPFFLTCVPFQACKPKLSFELDVPDLENSDGLFKKT